MEVGPDCVLAAQVGVSGSVKMGRGCTLGGQVGLADHISLGDGTLIGAQSGVPSSLEGGQVYLGSPAQPLRLAQRIMVAWSRLPELLKRVKSLEKRLADLEAGAGPKGE